MTKDERNKPDRHLSGSDLDALIRNFFAKDLDEIIRERMRQSGDKNYGHVRNQIVYEIYKRVAKDFSG